MTRKRTSWYGIRTLVRLIATGKPKKTNKHFDPMSTLVEDRIVLFKADSFDSAIKEPRKKRRGIVVGHASRTSTGSPSE